MQMEYFIHVYMFSVYLSGDGGGGGGYSAVKSDFKESRAVVIKADIDSLLCS